MTKDTKRIGILMLGGARRVSMAEQLKSAGKRLGYETEIFSYELTEEVPIATQGRVIVGLKWNDPKVVDDIARVCDEYGIGIILPFVDGAVEIAARAAERLKDLFVPVSDSDTAARMFDKVEAAMLFVDHRIPVPRAYSALTAEMPAIAKPRHGSASRGIKIFYNMDDLMQLDNMSDYLIQEYIENASEYTVDCYISQQGEILVTVPRVRLEVMGGEVTRTETQRNDQLEKMSRDIISAFNFRGPVTLQFLYDPKRDRYLLMEINPRLGGGVICSIYAGAPIADYILQEAAGVKVSPCTDWLDHTLMARYQKEAIFYNK